mmetsp:Transcript_20814/g.41947  ORF Transcript_20814/g.41947 Transcript_20814/m.41947 type:complete len:111 (-) Transcript_20814:56-388(-)
MENAIGGKLKLKKPLGGIKKKKKSKKTEEAGASSSAPEAAAAEADVEPEEDPLDPRTAYEKKWDEQIKKLDSKNAKKKAEQSHRDRINEFNDKLSKLSEHHDVPRVAGGA